MILTMDRFCIRRLRKEELPFLYREEGGETEGLRDFFLRHLKWQEGGSCVILVAWAPDGRAMGRLFVLFDDSMPPDYRMVMPSLADLLVYEPFRRKGVGSALLAAGEAEALKRSNCVFLTAEPGESLAHARRLYEKRGFVPDPSRGSDPICMIKTVHRA